MAPMSDWKWVVLMGVDSVDGKAVRMVPEMVAWLVAVKVDLLAVGKVESKVVLLVDVKVTMLAA